MISSVARLAGHHYADVLHAHSLAPHNWIRRSPEVMHGDRMNQPVESLAPPVAGNDAWRRFAVVRGWASPRRRSLGYLAALVAVALVSVAIGAVLGRVRIANISMLYLFAVLATAIGFGRGRPWWHQWPRS